MKLVRIWSVTNNTKFPILCLYAISLSCCAVAMRNTAFVASHLVGHGKNHFSSLTEKTADFGRWGGVHHDITLEPNTKRHFRKTDSVIGVWYYFDDYSYSFEKPVFLSYSSNVHAPHKHNLVYFSGDCDHCLTNDSDVRITVTTGVIYV